MFFNHKIGKALAKNLKLQRNAADELINEERKDEPSIPVLNFDAEQINTSLNQSFNSDLDSPLKAWLQDIINLHSKAIKKAKK